MYIQLLWSYKNNLQAFTGLVGIGMGVYYID